MKIMRISKEMTNLEASCLLRNVAAAYLIENERKNKFKIIAYSRAADAIEHLGSELKDLWDEGKLDQIPGIGSSMQKHFDEIFKTGKSKHFESILKDIPKQVFELMKLNGVGPRTAERLVNELGTKKNDPISQLMDFAQKGKIQTIPGFGVDSEEEIKQSILDFRKLKDTRMLLSKAEVVANELVDWMRELKECRFIEPLGSLRRKAATVGDIDIAVGTNNSPKVIAHFVSFPKKMRVLEQGQKKATILLSGNIQVDLMTVKSSSFGSLLQHFTGSKHHNIALRERAHTLGLSLSEYGIRKVGKKNGGIKTFETEEKFYKYLGLSYIPPEMREGAGEIELAKSGRLPNLVELNDIKGDFHIHSDFNVETSHDYGESSMEVIVKRASEKGYEYIAFSEHNPSMSGHNKKQIVEILKRKCEAVEEFNSSISKNNRIGVKRVFNSLEIDILPDGRLPVAEDGFKYLDFALVSIHSSFRLSRNEMTKRVLSALSWPKVKIFAHPSARKLNYREGVELNWERIFEFCLRNNKWIEINADPSRLDLPDFMVRDAVKRGVLLTLGTDSHNVNSLENMKYGVYVAQRGWAEKKNIVNTRTLKEFEKMLES